MALDVSLLARMLKGYEEGEQKRELVTRDLLGGGGAVLGSAEVDLELRVPAGWERRLDLLVDCSSPSIVLVSLPNQLLVEFELLKFFLLKILNFHVD